MIEVIRNLYGHENLGIWGSIFKITLQHFRTHFETRIFQVESHFIIGTMIEFCQKKLDSIAIICEVFNMSALELRIFSAMLQPLSPNILATKSSDPA